MIGLLGVPLLFSKAICLLGSLSSALSSSPSSFALLLFITSDASAKCLSADLLFFPAISLALFITFSYFYFFSVGRVIPLERRSITSGKSPKA